MLSISDIALKTAISMRDQHGEKYQHAGLIGHPTRSGCVRFQSRPTSIDIQWLA